MTEGDKNRYKRKYWTPHETQAFLECYLSRKEDFEHKRKKRNAYQKVLQDLISRGVVDPSTTAAVLESRMQTLVRAYRAGKLNKCKSRAATYLNLIFGDKLKHRDDTLEDKTSELSVGKPAATTRNTLNYNKVPAKAINDIGYSIPSTTQEFLSASPIDIKLEIPSRCPSFSACSPTSDFPKTDEFNEAAREEHIKRRVAREKFYSEKLKACAQRFELKMQEKRKYFNEMLASSERRFQEAEDAKMRRHREKMDFLSNILLK